MSEHDPRIVHLARVPASMAPIGSILTLGTDTSQEDLLVIQHLAHEALAVPVASLTPVEQALVEAVATARAETSKAEQGAQKLQEALDSSLAGAQEDEQEKAAMRELLEDACEVIKRGSYGNEYPEEIELMEQAIARYRAFLAAHPAPEEGGLEADDDE